MRENPAFSVVICSINALRFAEASLCYEELLADFPHEIIGIHDASSLAEGYNRGLRRALGDIVIFSHDDVLILDPAFATKIATRMQTFDILGFAGTTHLCSEAWFFSDIDKPGVQAGIWGSLYEAGSKLMTISSGFAGKGQLFVGDIQALDGLCFMARREVAIEIGFDEITFDGWHFYDLDFTFAAYLAGKKLGVCRDIPILHASNGDFDEAWLHQAQKFLDKYSRYGIVKSGLRSRNASGKGVACEDLDEFLAMWRLAVDGRQP
jgi:GT2 family glycosyltransferase